MFKFTTISTNDGEYKLSANQDKDGNFYMPFFATIGDTVIADHEPFLIEDFYSWLCGKTENEEFEGYYSSYKEELKEIFDEGINIGMFSEYYESYNNK